MELKVGIYKAVDDAILARSKKEKHRDYLGASCLGEECSRKLFYMYHIPFSVEDPRVQRIFDLGHILEDYMVKLLKDAGITVYAADENGEQFGFVDGKVAGHCDGVAVGLPESTKPHLLEFKTASAKRFKEFQKKGVSFEPKYLVQCHVYMYKLELENCLFVVLNKDNQELYFERMKLDKILAQQYILRGKEITEAKVPPARKYSKPTFYKCKWCDYAKECWEGLDD